jgi:hypothetical protein
VQMNGTSYAFSTLTDANGQGVPTTNKFSATSSIGPVIWSNGTAATTSPHYGPYQTGNNGNSAGLSFTVQAPPLTSTLTVYCVVEGYWVGATQPYYTLTAKLEDASNNVLQLQTFTTPNYANAVFGYITYSINFSGLTGHQLVFNLNDHNNAGGQAIEMVLGATLAPQ